MAGERFSAGVFIVAGTSLGLGTDDCLIVDTELCRLEAGTELGRREDRLLVLFDTASNGTDRPNAASFVDSTPSSGSYTTSDDALLGWASVKRYQSVGHAMTTKCYGEEGR